MKALPVHGSLAVVAGLLALAAAVAGSPDAGGEAGRIRWTRAAERGEGTLEAVELGEWIRGRRPDLRVIDLRDEPTFAAFHLPGAERLDSAGLSELMVSPEEVVVLYAGDDASAAAAWASLRSRSAGSQQVLRLRGGAGAWLAEVMDPMLPVDPSASERAEFERAVELSGYFGGMPRRGVPRAEWVAESQSGFGEDLTDVLKRMRRRGCAF